jgi:hypothetical protein
MTARSSAGMAVVSNDVEADLGMVVTVDMSFSRLAIVCFHFSPTPG